MAVLNPVVSNPAQQHNEPLGATDTMRMPIVDAGNYFPVDDVEAALQKLAGDAGGVATPLVAGKVIITPQAQYPASENNDTNPTTPAYVKAAIAAIPNATQTVYGKVQMTLGADYPAANIANEDTKAVTALYLKNALAASATTPPTITPVSVV